MIFVFPLTFENKIYRFFHIYKELMASEFTLINLISFHGFNKLLLHTHIKINFFAKQFFCNQLFLSSNFFYL